MKISTFSSTNRNGTAVHVIPENLKKIHGGQKVLERHMHTMANESTSNQLNRIVAELESVKRRLLILPDEASLATSTIICQSAADLSRRLVEIAVELNKLSVPRLMSSTRTRDSKPPPVALPSTSLPRNLVLQGLGTNSHLALEFEPDRRNAGEVLPWRTDQMDALESSVDVSARLEMPLLPREHTSLNEPVARGPPQRQRYLTMTRLVGTLIAISLMMMAMSRSSDSTCDSRNLPAPVERYAKLWQCAAQLSGGDTLLLQDDSPQARAVEWFVTGAGRGLIIPTHCTAESDFATMYALLVIRESLTVPDASWYSYSNVNIHVNTKVESLQQVCRDWTRIQCNQKGQITGLILGDANLAGTLPKELSILQHLTTLQIHSNLEVTGSLPVELSRLTNLEVLMLQQTHLAGTVPSQWGRLTSLQQLLLDETLLTGTVPAEICRLRKEHALDSLHANCRGDHALLQCSCCTQCK
jgi:hypothetical protein